MDTLKPSARSERMRRIQSKDTKPELVVRRVLHSCGYRFRLGGSGLPGRPDIVLPGRRVVIFVHGCFWHRHKCRAGCSVPKTRTSFWLRKFSDNRRRDQRVRRQLYRSGWRSIVVWECQVRDLERLSTRLRQFLR